jgi:hypothetical protein
MSDQLKVFSRLAVEQMMLVLKDVLTKEPVPQVQATVLQDLMPDDIVEKVWSAILNEPSVQEVKVSIAHLKTFPYALPFMPDRIDYKIGSCCDEIVYAKGLFTPCSKPCKEGNKCRAHVTPSGFGDYQSRLAIWDNGNGIGKMQVTPDTDPTRIKAFKEATYGEFCHKCQLTEETVNKALRDANLMLSVDRRNFTMPVKTRKVRGRPAKKLVEEVVEVREGVSLDESEAVSLDESEAVSLDEKSEEETEEPKEEPKEELVEEETEPKEPKEEPAEKPKLARPRVKKPKAEGETKAARTKKPKADGESETESETESEPKARPKPRTKKPKAEKVSDGVGTSLDAEVFEEE